LIFGSTQHDFILRSTRHDLQLGTNQHDYKLRSTQHDFQFGLTRLDLQPRLTRLILQPLPTPLELSTQNESAWSFSSNSLSPTIRLGRLSLTFGPCLTQLDLRHFTYSARSSVWSDSAWHLCLVSSTFNLRRPSLTFDGRLTRHDLRSGSTHLKLWPRLDRLDLLPGLTLLGLSTQSYLTWLFNSSWLILTLRFKLANLDLSVRVNLIRPST